MYLKNSEHRIHHVVKNWRTAKNWINALVEMKQLSLKCIFKSWYGMGWSRHSFDPFKNKNMRLGKNTCYKRVVTANGKGTSSVTRRAIKTLLSARYHNSLRNVISTSSQGSFVITTEESGVRQCWCLFIITRVYGDVRFWGKICRNGYMFTQKSVLVGPIRQYV